LELKKRWNAHQCVLSNMERKIFMKFISSISIGIVLACVFYTPISLSEEEIDPKFMKIAEKSGITNIKISEANVKSVKTFKSDDTDYISIDFIGRVHSPDGDMLMTHMETSFSSKDCYIPTSSKRIRIYSGDIESNGIKYRNYPFCLEDISNNSSIGGLIAILAALLASAALVFWYITWHRRKGMM
jgi:hypothetical protein